MDAGSDRGSAAKRSAVDLEVVGSGPLVAIFLSLLFSYTRCRSACLSIMCFLCEYP